MELTKNRNSKASVHRTPPCVRDLMTPDPFTLFVDDNLKVLEELMEWRNIRHVPVVDQNGLLVGLVTHRDFLRLAISQLAEVKKAEIDKLYSEISIGRIMGTNVVAVSPETSLQEAAEIMTRKKYGCLPVTVGAKLVGIITEADFVKAFYDWDAFFTNDNETKPSAMKK